ncbi:hypothetical protein JRQ81_009697 [Phrynocephalus forsythii]|uniref:Uncharacterized protein n=1 Tax=Phrynocephalus forsythii TaxID=171643 RepID=A0A9Q0Y5Q8_9SAUR|nr:hypothetical protein JRQ81_009697 [Phrynocephalus forsythii]
MARGTEPEREAEAEAEESLLPASRLLDAVLNDLYDFGGPLLDGNKKLKRKKRNSLKKVAKTAEDRYVNPEFGAVIPGKRKKSSNFFDSLKEEQADNCINQEKSVPEYCSSSAAQQKSDQQGNLAEVEVVIFHGRPKKKKDEWDNSEINDSKVKMIVPEKHASSQRFNLEKARLEVHQFGITGFEKKEQRVLEQERAIMLGAKPPKKEYLNYKILQQKIKEKKTAKKEENFMETKSDSLKRRKKKGHGERKSRKKTKQSILPTGQVGTFKNGTLILRSSDIKKIKSSKVVK